MGLPPPSPEQLWALETMKEQLASLRRARAICGGGFDEEYLFGVLDDAIAARVVAVQNATPPRGQA
eukprot:6754213-Prorocentrum_lima.AAC.1